MKSIGVLISVTLVASYSYAVDVTLRARNNENLGDFFFSSMAASSSTLAIKVNLSCFASDLRNVANPISPAGVVKMNFGIGPNSNVVTKQGQGDFALIFPGWMAMNRPTPSAKVGPDGLPDGTKKHIQDPNISRNDVINLNHADLRNGTAYGVQNMIVIRPPKSINAGITLTGGLTGKTTYTRGEALNALRYISFDQDIQARDKCYGVPLPVASFSWPDIFPKFLLELIGPEFVRAGDGYNPTQDNSVGQATNPTDEGYKNPKCNTGQIGWDMNASIGANMISANQKKWILEHYSEYTGHDGPLTGEWRAAWSSDFQTLEVTVAFPGPSSVCGAFYSPLMLFFDENRPNFTARTDFRIHPMSNGSYWPEATAPGYFLVLDLNHNGRIDDWTELFGEDEGRKNGFDKLGDYDSNGDGVIDAKDPVFKKLKLWRDTTGTGHSRTQDLHSLQEFGVTSISLDYEYKSQLAIANRARLREKSHFNFIKKGRKQRGEIVDVWFSN